MASDSDKPGVIAPPPILFGVFFGVAVILHWMHPLPIPLSPRAAFWPCVVLLNLSWPLVLWATGYMWSAGTHINPLRPATALVTSGPYRFSRNPLSVSLLLLYLGLAFQINSSWPLILFLPLLIVNHYGVVLREERYLEAKFGDPYRNYRAAVRRWI
ncbi:MAG: isoprenylcysteine carboxylmethyltransferase family protein [Tepidisphaeraceae bacterium]|jgi:protein-S-isoprenylcysteine O-methyltransferase Ste14